MNLDFGNIITIHSKKYLLFGEPLNTFWNLISNKPSLGSFSSSPLDKGYFAKWVLKDNRLFLEDFKGIDIWCKKHYKYEDYFGIKGELFFAFWFTGELKTEEGDVIFSNHHFGDTMRYIFTMTFEKGILIETQMGENK